MNKSLLMLLAVAIMGTNLVATAPTEKKSNDKKNSCFCYDRCDHKVAKERCGCKSTPKKERAPKKETKCGCCTAERVTPL